MSGNILYPLCTFDRSRPVCHQSPIALYSIFSVRNPRLLFSARPSPDFRYGISKPSISLSLKPQSIHASFPFCAMCSSYLTFIYTKPLLVSSPRPDYLFRCQIRRLRSLTLIPFHHLISWSKPSMINVPFPKRFG